MSTQIVKTRFRVRRRTAAGWESVNEILLGSEIGHESDTDKLKIGDGETPWNDLPYLSTGGGGGGPAPVIELTGAAYTLADLTPGAWHQFTSATEITLTAANESGEAIEVDAEFGLSPRGAGRLAIVSGAGVTVRPPLAGSAVVSSGGFSVLKRTQANVYDLVGATEAAVDAWAIAYDDTNSGLDAFTVQEAIEKVAEKVHNAKVITLSGTTYTLSALTPGGWHVFTATGLVTITAATNASSPIETDAEFGMDSRGAGGVLISAAAGVTLIPPKGGTMKLEQHDFAVLKRTASDVYKLVGSTEASA